VLRQATRDTYAGRESEEPSWRCLPVGGTKSHFVHGRATGDGSRTGQGVCEASRSAWLKSFLVSPDRVHTDTSVAS